MIVDGIHENYRVDAFQRPLLPFFCDGENLVRDTAYGRVGHLYAVDIPNMGLNIRRGHAFGVHGQDLLLDVLTDAGLILLQELRFKLPLSVPRDSTSTSPKLVRRVLLLCPFRLLSVFLFL